MSKLESTRKQRAIYRTKAPSLPVDDAIVHGTDVSSAPFELREDGTIVAAPDAEKRIPVLKYSDEANRLWLYQGNSLELLDAITTKYPDGRFDAIFADPPYFLSNGGISCHAGRMVKVDTNTLMIMEGNQMLWARARCVGKVYTTR